MGEDRYGDFGKSEIVVLARQDPFTIGALHVDPATRQVKRAGATETLEPRVMQVLVALAEANGRIVTRDELIDRCWGGRIVSEDAINRAIFRVRQIASTIGAGTFLVETIIKVGYRIVSKPAAASTAERTAVGLSQFMRGRRKLLIAGGAATVSALGIGVSLNRPWRRGHPSDAVEAFRLGDVALKEGTPEQARQSVAYFELAVRLDPAYGRAWGALALSYTQSVSTLDDRHLATLAIRVNSAAGRALELDPDNPDAQLAIACIPPYFRNWKQMEPQLRTLLNRFPTHWQTNARLANLYWQVGRLTEASDLWKKVIALDPMIPLAYFSAATALSSAGRIQEADAILEVSSERWPANQLVWYARFQHLLFSGRAGAAEALATDPESLPADFPQDKLLTLARAVDRKQPRNVDSIVRFLKENSRSDIRNVWSDVPILALLGLVDLAFAMMDRYFLDRGPFGSPAPIHRYTPRLTNFLYSLPMAVVRADSRYGDLTRAIGLDDYWRWKRMSPPDLRIQ